VALLNCRPALRQCRDQAQDTDERAAYSILLKALEVPFTTIIENAGVWAGKILAEADQAGPGYGYDVMAHQLVQMTDAGILDTAPVVKGAVRSAISGAALALTTEAVVHRKNPPDGLNT
jgi:chaperonin GroEL